MNLSVTDTPGIADTNRRSRFFLDKIMTHLKHNNVDMIFIVMPYGRTDIQF